MGMATQRRPQRWRSDRSGGGRLEVDRAPEADERPLPLWPVACVGLLCERLSRNGLTCPRLFCRSPEGLGFCLPTCRTACPIAQLSRLGTRRLWAALDSCVRLSTSPHVGSPGPFTGLPVQRAGGRPDLILATHVQAAQRNTR